MSAKAVIFDLDGTLALKGSRHFADWLNVDRDEPNEPIVDILRILYLTGKYRIIIASGRDSVCRNETIAWLNDHAIYWDELLMRRAGDNRQDAIVKAELYEEHVKPYYRVMYVFDDRDQVVRMWRHKYGLTVLQVAEGDF